MHAFRRYLATLALAMATVLLCSAAGVTAAICGSGSARSSSINAEDCCPPGSHPGQMCPMHKHSATRTLDPKAPAFCGCRSLSPVGIVAIGVMPSAPVLSTPLARIVVHDIPAAAIVDLPRVPTAPPPRA